MENTQQDPNCLKMEKKKKKERKKKEKEKVNIWPTIWEIIPLLR